MDLAPVEVDVVGRECEQLPEPEAGPVEHLDGREHDGVVGEELAEAEVLLLAPEGHLLGLVLADPGRLGAGVGAEPVVALGVGHDSHELRVERSHVRAGVGLAVPLPSLKDPVLPGEDVLSGDVAEPFLPEERDDLVVDHVLLGVPGVLADEGPHVLAVHLDEVGEAHVEGAARAAQEAVLELVRLLLGGEAPLALVLGVAVDVLVAELARPRSVLLQCGAHLAPPSSSPK